MTVLPGDVVLGTPTGIVFIPPHLAQEVVERSEDIRVRDDFGKLRLTEGKYTPGEIDRAWSEEIEADYKEWLAQRREYVNPQLTNELLSRRLSPMCPSHCANAAVLSLV